MITAVRIRNYKLFKSFELTGLSPILLIGGKNNSGKTSLLEAIFFPLDCANPSMFVQHLKWRGLDSTDINFSFASSYHKLDMGEPIEFEHTFKPSKTQPSKIKRQYKRLAPSSAPLSPGPDGQVINLREKLANNFGSIEISFWADGKKQPDAFLTPELDRLRLKDIGRQMSGYKILPVTFSAPAAFSPSEENARLYGELDKVNKAGDIVKALRIIEPKLKSLSIIPLGGKPVLYGDTGMGKKLPLKLMGQGMERLADILLAISEVRGGIVLADELESGFHHSVLRDVWAAIASYAKSNRAQLIATTHSRELTAAALEGIPKDLRDGFKYMRIEREGDSFKAKKYDFETLGAAVEGHLEFR